MSEITSLHINKYLDYLEKQWHTFDNPLYTLENYLAMGAAAWAEANSRERNTARSAGATHYSPFYQKYYKAGSQGTYEAQIIDGQLTEWKLSLNFYPPESAGRI